MPQRVRSTSAEAESINVHSKYSYQQVHGDCFSSPYGVLEVYDGSEFTYKDWFTSKTMTDSNDPGFYRDQAQGKIRNNYMKMESVSEVTKIGRLKHGYDGYTTLQCVEGPRLLHWGWIQHDNLWCPKVCTGNNFISSKDFNEDIEDLKSLAVTDCWASISEADVLSIVCLVESVKTVKGIIELFKQFRLLYNTTYELSQKLKRGPAIIEGADAPIVQLYRSMKGSVQSAKLADLYMNFRYGVRPLVYDLIGLYKALQPEMLGQRKVYRRGQHLDHREEDTIDWVAYSHPGSDFEMVVPIHRVYEHSCTIRAGVLAQWDCIDRSFGWDRWIETAWELIPYSFIIDWFINLGDTIMSWAPIAGAKVLTSWVTTDEVITQSIIAGDAKMSGSANGMFNPYCVSSGSVTRVTRIKTRTPNPPRSWVPQFNLKLNAAKLLDLAIILANVKSDVARKPLRF